MTDFFEKIKKGMDSKGVIKEPEEIKELEQPEEQLEEELEGEESSAELISVQADEIEEPTEEPSVELTSFEIDEPEEQIEQIEELGKKPKKKATKKKSAKKPAKKVVEEKLVKKIEIKTEIEEPVSEHKRIEEKLFDGPEGELTVDVYQSGNDLIVRSAIAGVDPEDLDITIENDLVIISGQREQNTAEEKDNYFFQECYWGRFRREIILPLEVDSSRANAKMEKGVLIIRIPIIEERKKKTKISIE